MLAIVCAPLWIWKCPVGISIIVTVICVVFFLLVTNFFRSPRRQFRGNRENVVVASADGKVVALEEVYEGEYLKQNVIQLSVFMSILNVHANWFPVDGEVIYATHHRGRFMAAYLPKSSTENERSTVVTYARPGDEASIEDHMGFIKFGSRVDIFLPLDTEIFVKIGDTTIGGVTTIGRLRPLNPDSENA